ncbi:suppressor of fused domain protein [Exiguobacterium sp. USCH10]|jgi:hypothetical protein|uniref:suppressor of fused domain protein n=1 Tax=Exiguobacterium sp. USCH10 TaxID=3024839 RepID=UPI0030B45E5F
MNYLEHLEKHCGTFVSGYDIPYLLEDDVQIIELEEESSKITSISTLGLHWHALQFENGSTAHQELLFRFNQQHAKEEFVELMWQLTDFALGTHQAFELGELYELPEEVLEQYSFSSVYVTAPFYSDESFITYENEEQSVLVVWFVPIYPSEELFIEEHGTERFDELLYETDRELFDLNRKELV